MNLKNYLFVLLVLLVTFVSAQKPKGENYDITYNQTAIIDALGDFNTYNSNDEFLQFENKERSETPEYTITAKILETGRINYSPAILVQPVLLTIDDSNKNQIYYRIFNDFREEDQNSATTMSESYRLFDPISKYFNLVFNKSTHNFRLKLFFINKSDEHNDVNDGYQKSVKGIEAFNDGNQEMGKQLFVEAVELWENALKEADIKNKKARINKDITAAIYKNLVQVLPFVGRAHDAGKLIDTYIKDIGGLGGFMLEGKRPMINQLKIFSLANDTNKEITLRDIEIPLDVKPLTADSDFFLMENSADLRNFISGSWILFHESFELPKSEDEVTLDGRGDCAKHSRLHILPSGELISQNGSFETDCKFELEESRFWKIQKSINNDYYLRVAEDVQDFKGNFTQNFELIHLTHNMMIIKGSTYRDYDTTRFTYMQFYRISTDSN